MDFLACTECDGEGTVTVRPGLDDELTYVCECQIRDEDFTGVTNNDR